jgi:peptidoglycan/LPS O-acetylase OafA/YrhL
MAASSVAEKRRSFYRPELDVLRFGAFLLVFIHHGFPLTTAEYVGWGVPQTLAALLASGARAAALSVDLFFALSAYLITELLLREQRSRGRFDIRAFYVRRILRIWPLYYFALLFLLPLLALALPADQMSGNFWLAFLLFAGNWACALSNVYPTALAVLWTVSIEEQFYIAWPWLLRLFGSRMPLCAAGMVAIAAIARGFVIGRHADLVGMDARVWANTLTRLDPIAGGALLAFLLQGRTPRHTLGKRLLWLGCGGLVLWITGSVLKEPGWIWLLTYPLATAGCLAIIYGSFGPDGERWPGILTYLGKITFGLYVFHVAAIRLVQALSPSLTGPLVLVSAFALTVGAAALSYRYLESPFLRLKDRFAHVSTRTV